MYDLFDLLNKQKNDEEENEESLYDLFDRIKKQKDVILEVEEPNIQMFDPSPSLQDGEASFPTSDFPDTLTASADGVLEPEFQSKEPPLLDGTEPELQTSRERAPMSDFVSGYTSPDQATLIGDDPETAIGETKFSVQRGVQVPKVQKELSSDPSRNGILNALVYFEGKDNSALIQEYARQVVNEAHLPMGDRPKNAKYARQNKEIREEIESVSDIGPVEETIRSFAASFQDPDFLSPKRYEERLFEEETFGLKPIVKQQIKEQLNFYRPYAEKMSPEDLIRDSTKSNSAAVNFLGDAAGIFTFPVVIAGSVGSTFLGSGKLGARQTTLHREQIGEDINAARSYSTSKKVRDYRKKTDNSSEPMDIVFNLATDGSPGFSDIQGYGELSLRGPRSEEYSTSPKFLPHEIAQAHNAIEENKDEIKARIRSGTFTKEQLERIKKTPRGIEGAVDKTFEDAVNFLFIRNKDEIPKSRDNMFAVSVAKYVLSDYLPKETEGDKLGKLVEDAQTFFFGDIQRALSKEGGPNAYRKAFEKVTNSKNINMSDQEFNRRKNEYIYNEILKYSEQAAKDGAFGKSWSETDLRSKAAGIMISTFNSQNMPEYGDALSEYGGRFADAIFSEETFNDMVLDSWAGFLPGASREQQLRTEKKWEQHPLYAALDAAAVGVVIGKIGKVTAISRRAYKAAIIEAQAGNSEPLRRLFLKAYQEEKKHIETVKIRPEEDKFAETNFDETIADQPVQLRIDNAEEATILHSERKAAELREQAAQTNDPALKKQLEKDAAAEEQLAKSKLDYYDGLDLEEGGVAKFADETIETSSKSGPQIRKKYAEEGKALRGQDTEQRAQYFYNDSLNDVKIIDELYKENPADAAKVEARISSEIEELAKSNNIKADDTRGLINSLIEAGYTDAQYYRHVIYNSSSPKISKTPETVAGFITEAKQFSYTTGTAKRLKTIDDIIKDSPISVLSDSAKVGKDDFLNRRDSLIVAEQLAISGAKRPSAYYGLNLTDAEIDKFIEVARTRNERTAVIQSKVKKNPDYAVDHNGDFIGFKDRDVSESPTRVSNVSEDLYVDGNLINKLGKIGKTVGRVLGQQFGRAPYRLFQEGKREGSQLYYTFMATMEYMQNPFAVFNVPNLYRNALSEGLRFAYVNGIENSVTKMLQAAVKPSLEAGDFYFQLRRLSEQGRISEDEFIKVINELPDFEKDFIVDEALVVESLGKSAASDYNPVTITGDDLETTFINIHKGLDQPLPDGSVPSELFGFEVDMTKRFVRRIEEIEAELVRLGPNGAKSNYGRKLTAEGQDLQSKLNAGDVYLKVDDPYFGDKGVTNAQQYKDSGEFRLYSKVKQEDMTDYQKAIYSIVEQRLLPAQKKVFDIVGQIVSGADSQRLVLESSPSPKKMVVRIKRDANGETYELVKDFSDMENGVQQAQAMLNELSKKEVKQEFEPKLKDVDEKLKLGLISESEAAQQRNKIIEEMGVAKSSGSTNYLLLNEDGYAARKSYGKDYMAPATTRPYISFGKDDYMAKTIQYISTFQETQGVLKIIKNHLDEIAESGLEGVELAMKREQIMRKMLSLVPDGAKMLKESGNNAGEVFTKILKMTDAEQQTRLGRVLSPEERFFFKMTSESGFTKSELLDSFSNYKFALTQTMMGLQGNLNLAKSFNLLRNKGQLITKSEFKALQKSNPAAANMFMQAGDVQSRTPSQVVTKGTTQQVKDPTESIFGTTMDGFYISKPAASFMSKQAGLQKLSERKATKALQAFKFSKIIDPFGGAFLRNAYSAISFHGYGAGPVISNPKTVLSFYNDYQRIIRGEEPKDPRVLAIIRAGAGMATEKRELSLNMGTTDRKSSELFTTFIMRMLSENPNLPSKLSKIDENSPESVLDEIIEALNLTGQEKEMNRFLQEIKAETSPDSVRVRDLERITPAEKAERIARRTGSSVFGWLLDKYSAFDRHMAGGYALQLMDKYNLKVMDALKIADEVFVDYMDMSSLLNVFRYQAAAGLFGMPFVGYIANGVNLAARMLTEGTSRSWLASHLVQANDTAVEGMLDLGMSMQEYTSLFQDPTAKIFPYETATVATGTEFRGGEVPGEGFLSGPVGASLSSILPFPVDAKILARGVPAFDQDKGVGAEDIFHSFLGTIGGPLDEFYRKFKTNNQDSFRVQKAREMQKAIDNIENSDMPEEKKESILKLIRLDPLSRLKDKGGVFEQTVRSVLVPSFVSNLGRLYEGEMGETRSALETRSKFLGLKAVPYSTRQVLSSRLLDSETRREAKAHAEVGTDIIKRLNTGQVDYPEFSQEYANFLKERQRVNDQIELAKTDVNRALLVKLQQELELIADKTLYLYLSGNIEQNQLNVILETLE